MKYKILFIEDSINDVDLMLFQLKRKGIEVEYIVVDNASDLNKTLGKKDWDIIISDHNMPGFSADEAFKIVKEKGIDIPFIVVSGTIKHEKAIEIMKMGARDYVLKDNVNKLPLIVIREVEDYKKKKMNEEINKKHLAIFNNISDLVLLFSLDENNKIDKIVDYNPLVLQKLQYTKEELLIMKPCDLIKCEKLYMNHMIQETLNGIILEDKFEINGKNKKMFGDVKLNTLDYQGKKYIIATIRDITEQEIIEKKLSDSEKRFGSIFNNTSIGIFVTDESGKIVNVNDSLCKIFKKNKKEILGKNSDEINLFGISKRFNQIYREIDKRIDNELTYEEKIPLEDGEKNIYARYNASMYYSRSENKKYIISTFEDITEVTKTKIELEKAIHTLNKSLNSLISVLGKITEERDRYTAGHQVRVAMLSKEIAREMELGKKEIEEIEIAGRIHDIGKITVPSEILTRPGKISEIEYRMIKAHPITAYEILKDSEMPELIWKAVYEHHERLNGKGYPRGLKGEEITIEAKILGVADVVDAMTSHRPYRPALSLENAFEELDTFSGEKYDPEVVLACKKVFKKGFKFPDKTMG